VQSEAGIMYKSPEDKHHSVNKTAQTPGDMEQDHANKKQNVPSSNFGSMIPKYVMTLSL